WHSAILRQAYVMRNWRDRQAPCRSPLRVALLAIAVSLALLVGPAAARAATQLQPVSYTDFDGHAETLVPWQGEKVVVLTDPRTTRDPDVMTRLVGRSTGHTATTQTRPGGLRP